MKLALKFQKTDGSEIAINLADINRVVHSGGNGTHTLELTTGHSHTVDLKKSIGSGIPIIDTDPDQTFATPDGGTMTIPTSKIVSINPDPGGGGNRILIKADSTRVELAPA